MIVNVDMPYLFLGYLYLKSIDIFSKACYNAAKLMKGI